MPKIRKLNPVTLQDYPNLDTGDSLEIYRMRRKTPGFIRGEYVN